MNLINELQEDILNQSNDLSSILRKAKVLAYKLKNEEMKAWVNNELNGYSDRKELPDYRRFSAVNRGNFYDSFGRQLKNAPITLMNIPEKVRQRLDKFDLYHGVKSLESAIESGENTFKYPWSPEIIALFSDKFYVDFACGEAWKAVNVELYEQVLDNIRTRLLDFILELQEKCPDIQDSNDNIPKIPENEVSTIFHTYIFGGQCSIASSFDNCQIVQQHVQKNDLPSLLKYLEEIGIPSSEIKNVEVAIKNDNYGEEKKGIGSNVQTWISNFSQKLFSGALGKATDISLDLIMKAVLAYYGLT